MLIIAGLLFIFIDFFMGGVDLIPDMMGYFLIFAALFRGHYTFKLYPSRLLLWNIAAAVMAVISGNEAAAAWMVLLTLVLQAVCQYFLLRGIWKTHRNLLEPKEKTEQDSMMQTALVFTLICEICYPILSLLPLAGYILTGLELIVGCLICVWMWHVIKASKKR